MLFKIIYIYIYIYIHTFVITGYRCEKLKQKLRFFFRCIDLSYPFKIYYFAFGVSQVKSLIKEKL